MFPRRSEEEDLEYPFFEGDGSSSDEWRDYGMLGKDYKGPLVFDDDQYEEELMPVYDTDIEDVIEKEEGFIGKGGSNEEEKDGDKDEDVIEEEEGFVGKGGSNEEEKDGDKDEDILPCTRDAKCPRYGCSLHVNSDGNELRVRKNNHNVLYDGDASFDGESCENIVATSMLKELGLDVEDHPAPYQLTWLKKEMSLRLRNVFFFTFRVGKNIKKGI
nr:probable LRR receptor-like serine/threonine-protein kinase RFK1 isoform X2 [Tanacetum cinerariifolium]